MEHLIITIVGIAFVMFSFIRGLSIWTTHLEEKQRIRLTANKQGQQLDQSTLEDLRGEIMRLRDTTTQYDMSVERTLSEVKNRLDHLESERSARIRNAEVLTASEPLPELQQLINGQQS